MEPSPATRLPSLPTPFRACHQFTASDALQEQAYYPLESLMLAPIPLKTGRLQLHSYTSKSRGVLVLAKLKR